MFIDYFGEHIGTLYYRSPSRSSADADAQGHFVVGFHCSDSVNSSGTN